MSGGQDPPSALDYGRYPDTGKPPEGENNNTNELSEDTITNTINPEKENSHTNLSNRNLAVRKHHSNKNKSSKNALAIDQLGTTKILSAAELQIFNILILLCNCKLQRGHSEEVPGLTAFRFSDGMNALDIDPMDDAASSNDGQRKSLPQNMWKLSP